MDCAHIENNNKFTNCYQMLRKTEQFKDNFLQI